MKKINRYEAAEIETGLKYWRGELASTPVRGDFRPSRKQDVFDVFENLSARDARRYEKIAVQSVVRGEGVFSMLVAGASARMNTRAAPREVRNLLRNRKILSKAAVPIGFADGKPITYLDEFVFNLSRLLKSVHEEAKRSGIDPRVNQNQLLLFSNPAYLSEHRKILDQKNFFGLSKGQVRFILQPLGAKYWARPEDVHRLDGKVPEPALRKMLARAKKIEAQIRRTPESVIVPDEREPLGHGEYFHQIISSGEILRWLSSGKKWIFVKNVDNCAAKLDKVWLQILGYFLDRGLDFQVEVSPRSVGQTGGSLIVMKDSSAHQIAEDPNILATNRIRGHIMSPSDSYWFNDAVALFTPRYVLNLYKLEGQSDREFVRELEKASPSVRRKIAERGRALFPSILDVKPAKRKTGATVKRETNLWQSTGLVPDEIRVNAIGVRGARHLPLDRYFDPTFKDKNSELSRLRVLSTKQWFLPEPVIRGAQKKLEKDLKRKVTRFEALLFLETYVGNKPLFEDLIQYNRKAEFVTPGILRSHGS